MINPWRKFVCVKCKSPVTTRTTFNNTMLCNDCQTFENGYIICKITPLESDEQSIIVEND